MKRTFKQTATKTITMSREIIVEFPEEHHPDSIDSHTLDAILAKAIVEWEVDDEDVEIDNVDWSDAEDDDEADVYYEE